MSASMTHAIIVSSIFAILTVVVLWTGCKELYVAYKTKARWPVWLFYGLLTGTCVIANSVIIYLELSKAL